TDQSAPAGADWSVAHCPDQTQLFRYSAVTFNAHRIHYDAPYARGVEGYDGIVVQGQLLATLMLRAIPGQPPVRQFSFRGVQPVYAGQPILTEGRLLPDGRAELWVRDAAGTLRMQGEAVLGG
ncbi:MAG: acyl-CoA dehydrogenase, partial [Rhodobacterales bacterium]|nr:acyl-CoA dehydrogenase [Rhodobacterales bacterium]